MFFIHSISSKLRRRFAIFKFLEKQTANTTFFSNNLLPEIPQIFMLLVAVGNFVDCFLKQSTKHAREFFSKKLSNWSDDTFNRSSLLYSFIQDSPHYVMHKRRTNVQNNHL